MKDNVNNYWGTAPDKGSMTGPILGSLNASTLSDIHGNNTETRRDTNSDDYWLSSLASSGQVCASSDFLLETFHVVNSWDTDALCPQWLSILP